MITPETRVQIRHYFYAEHWKIGTIARELGLHPETVRSAVEAQRLGGTQPLRPSCVDPFLPFVRHAGTASAAMRHPRLPDGARPRLRRQRRSVAARRGPSAAALNQRQQQNQFWYCASPTELRRRLEARGPGPEWQRFDPPSGCPVTLRNHPTRLVENAADSSVRSSS